MQLKGFPLTSKNDGKPSDEAMVALEDTNDLFSRPCCRGSKSDSLVVSVSHPRNCAYGADDDGNVCYRTNDENRIRVDRMVPEVVHDLQDEPANTGKCTTTVNASKMLQTS